MIKAEDLRKIAFEANEKDRVEAENDAAILMDCIINSKLLSEAKAGHNTTTVDFKEIVGKTIIKGKVLRTEYIRKVYAKTVCSLKELGYSVLGTNNRSKYSISW